MRRPWRLRHCQWLLALLIGLLGASLSACGAGVTWPPSLSLETLRNAEYPSEFTQSGRALLRDGIYQEPDEKGSPFRVVVRLAPCIARGWLAGRDVAAVVLFTNAGGSGTFFRLVVVEAGPRGPQAVAQTSLGDRIQLRALRFAGEDIVVDLVRQGPRDGLCCPTERASLRYALEAGDLVERQAMVWREAAAGLWNETWRLTRIERETEETIVVDSSRYTLRFSPGGTVTIRAGCTTGGGSYAVDGNRLEMQGLPLASTQCPPDPLADAYLRALGRARGFTFGGTGLQLEAESQGATLDFTREESCYLP